MKNMQNTRSVRVGNVVRAAGLAAAMVLTMPALAQNEREVQGSLDQPLEGAAQGSGSSTILMSESDGTTKYEVEVRNGKATAKIDGKKVPARRVRHADGRVEILGTDGEVLKTFVVGEAPLAPAVRGQRGMRGVIAPRSPFTPVAPMAPEPPVLMEMMSPPKTMLGIRMDDESQGEVVLTEVIEGLPAAKAGLEAGDALVSVAGKPIREVKDIREAIKEKDAGDKVEVVVRRDDEEKKFQVTLEAWNDKSLYKAEELPGTWAETIRGFGQAGEDTGKLAAEAREALKKALADIERSAAKSQFDESWSEAMRQAMKALEETGNGTQRWLRSFSAPSAPQARIYTTRPGQGSLFVTPRADGEMDERLEAMSRRLEEMSARLEKLTEALEKRNP